MKNDHINIVIECFEGDEEMSKKITLSLSYRRGPFTEMCAKYIHRQLKNNTTEYTSEEELESWMQKLTDLVLYLNMGAFQPLYLDYLAKRFRSEKKLPIKAERLMSQKFFGKFMQLFNTNLNLLGMNKSSIMSDIEDSLLAEKEFKEYLIIKQINLGLELNIKITEHRSVTGQSSRRLIFPPEVLYSY